MKKTAINNRDVRKTETNKTRNTNRKLVAGISAVFAATVMATGIAVFSASASTISNAPEKAKPTLTTTVTEKTAAESQPASDESVNENGKHPGEMGYCYYVNEQETQAPEMRMLGFNFEAVKANAERYEQETSGKHPGESGYNYVNENGKHPGECGYGYQANEQEPSGTF